MDEFMFNRILVPLDGSILAERVIPHAEQFARIFGASIILLRVLEAASHYENSDNVDPLSWQIRKAEADLYLREVAARIREHLQIPEKNAENETSNENRIEYAIREGRTSETIIDFAHNENIDLLVISSHGLGGLNRWNMSSIIKEVVDLVYLPLLIVRSFDPQEETGDRIHYRNILLPIDSSRRAECTLSPGIILAQGEVLLGNGSAVDLSGIQNPSPPKVVPGEVSSGSKLFLAAVIAPPEIPIPAPYPDEITKLSEQLLDVSREAVRAYLSEMKLRLPVETEIRVVESNNVSTALQELANQENIDLVLMSAHGYTGQFSNPYGSVTRNAMENGTKPILVIQDVPLSQVKPTAAAVAAEKSGRR
jgi:nucleotide-binding universal stress UspA family protein